MDNNGTVIKFINEKGEAREVGSFKDWRFQRGSGLSGFSSFDGDIKTRENYSRDGGKNEKARLSYKDRTIKIVYMHQDDVPEERDRFEAFFRFGETYKIYATYMGRTRWQSAELYKMELSENTEPIKKAMTATMTFRFESPYWLSVDDFGKDIASITPLFGFPYQVDMETGSAVGVFNFAHEVELKNEGAATSFPQIIIEAKDEVTNPIVQINEGFVKYNGILNEGDRLVIDCLATPPTVRLNGVNRIGRCAKESDFDNLNIKVGNNIASFDADNGSDEMTVSIFYNKMYTFI